MNKTKEEEEGEEKGTEKVKPEPPKKECNDKHCPFHGSNIPRGRTFTGKVISAKMRRTATIEWPRTLFIPKYERYEKRRSKIKAHNPDCINAKEGDTVKIVECKPISKTKSFVIIQKKVLTK